VRDCIDAFDYLVKRALLRLISSRDRHKGLPNPIIDEGCIDVQMMDAPLTSAMSLTIAYSNFAFLPAKSLVRYSPLSWLRTVPRTGYPSSRKAPTAWLYVLSVTTVPKLGRGWTRWGDMDFRLL
jgi:hypothetical protein